MTKKKIPLPWQVLKKAFKTEETRFFMGVGLKVSAISFIISSSVYYILFLVMRLNYGFFKANGFGQMADSTLFFDYVVEEALENIPLLFAFHIFLFFIGVYVGWLILRPFRIIGEYCETVIENPNAVYRVDQFSNFRLLTHFSEFFFEFLRESRRKGQIVANSIPPQYSRIHKPVVDVIFLLHFGLLMVIIAISSSVFIIHTTESIFSSMLTLAGKTLGHERQVGEFFGNQNFIPNELVLITVVLIALSYMLLGFHLYSKVSGAAFGIFSTMRAFMKGAYFSRVHLVGYSYIRENTRKLNKYLDYVENNLQKEKSKS